MFSKKSKYRNVNYNIQLASTLSFVAGFINVLGLVSVNRFTTNVTGHFASFAKKLFYRQPYDAFFFFLYVFFFLLGSFISSVLIEYFTQKNEKYAYIIPVNVEVFLLLILALFGDHYLIGFPNFIALMLLFTMGLQNALVTKISNAVVRTTHLTGLFTDLGIEISHLLFQKNQEIIEKTKKSIILRANIVIYFLLGGIIGAGLYLYFDLKSLFIPIGILIFGVLNDYIQYQIKVFSLKRNKYKFTKQKNEALS